MTGEYADASADRAHGGLGSAWLPLTGVCHTSDNVIETIVLLCWKREQRIVTGTKDVENWRCEPGFEVDLCKGPPRQ
jgi:hypothetical protein